MPNSLKSDLKKAATLPFRMVRFAFALIRAGRTDFLIREVRSFLNSIYNLSWFHMSKVEVGHGDAFTVQTDFPVAVDSPDHITPYGATENNITHYGFIKWAETTIQMSRRKVYLDLGCSSGALVRDFKSIGWSAVGLEGDDRSKKNGRAYWGEAADVNLFTADIGKPFMVFNHWMQVKFDLITAWHVLEHLDKDSVAGLCRNINEHSSRNTIFIATTGNCSEKQYGLELHRTQQDSGVWYQMLHDLMPGWIPFSPPPDYVQVRRCLDKGGRAICLIKN